MTVYWVVAVVILNLIGYKGSKVLLSLDALDLGANQAMIGVLIALYSVFPLVLAVPVGRMVDRTGYFWAILGGMAGSVVGLLLPKFVPGTTGLALSALAVGFSFAFFQVSVQAVVGALGSEQSRTRDYLTFSLGPATASFLGPLVAGFGTDHLGTRASYAVLAGIGTLGVVLFVLLRRRIPAPTIRAAKGEQRAADIVRDPKLLRMLIVSGLVITAIELFIFYLPIYGRSIGLSASWIGAILAAYAAATFVVRIVIPAFNRRASVETILTVAMFGAAVTYLLFPLFQNPWLLLVIAFVLGLGLGCGQPLSIVLAFNRAPPGRSSEALGMRITVNKLTEVLCPLLFGTLGAAAGIAAVFVSNALLLAGGGFVNRIDSRGSVPGGKT